MERVINGTEAKSLTKKKADFNSGQCRQSNFAISDLATSSIYAKTNSDLRDSFANGDNQQQLIYGKHDGNIYSLTIADYQ